MHKLTFVNIHLHAKFDENWSKTFEVIMNISPNCTIFHTFSLCHDLENQVKVTKTWYDLEFVNIRPRAKFYDNQSWTFEIILHKRQKCTIFHPFPCAVTLKIMSRSLKLDTSKSLSIYTFIPDFKSISQILFMWSRTQKIGSNNLFINWLIHYLPLLIYERVAKCNEPCVYVP